MKYLLIILFVSGCSDSNYVRDAKPFNDNGTCSYGMVRHKENGFWVYDFDNNTGKIKTCEK
jgi:hypothetical protein